MPSGFCMGEGTDGWLGPLLTLCCCVRGVRGHPGHWSGFSGPCWLKESDPICLGYMLARSGICVGQQISKNHGHCRLSNCSLLVVNCIVLVSRVQSGSQQRAVPFKIYSRVSYLPWYLQYIFQAKILKLDWNDYLERLHSASYCKVILYQQLPHNHP